MKVILIMLFLNIILCKPKIHFIYNANNDYFSIIEDFVHKNVSPSTYKCNLCKLSYGVFSKNNKWSNFLNSLEYEYSFIYKKEPNHIIENVNSFPVILYTLNDKIDVLVTTEEIKLCQSIDDLILIINNELLLINK